MIESQVLVPEKEIAGINQEVKRVSDQLLSLKFQFATDNLLVFNRMLQIYQQRVPDMVQDAQKLMGYLHAKLSGEYGDDLWEQFVTTGGITALLIVHNDSERTARLRQSQDGDSNKSSIEMLSEELSQKYPFVGNGAEVLEKYPVAGLLDGVFRALVQQQFWLGKHAQLMVRLRGSRKSRHKVQN